MPLFVGHVGVGVVGSFILGYVALDMWIDGLGGLVGFRSSNFCFIGAEVPGLSQLLVCPEVFISLQKIEREVSTLDLCSCSRQLEMHVKDGRVN